MRIKTRLKIILLTLATFLSIMYYKGCKEDKDVSNSITLPVRRIDLPDARRWDDRARKPPLKAGLGESTGPRYVPPEGKITVVSKQKDKEVQELVEIKVQTWGITWRPGLQLLLTPSFPNSGRPLLQASFGLDSTLVYFNRWSLQPLGVSFTKQSVDLNCGLSYRLDRIPFIHNAQLKFAYSPLTQRPYVGLRLDL